MKEVNLKILSNKALTKDTYLLTLKGDIKEIKNPGEFVEMTIPGFYLRRPFSVCDYTEDTLTILYKILGQGTKELSQLKNISLNTLVGLGNGFDISKSQKPLLLGGGIGIAPLLGLAKKFAVQKIRPLIILGFKNVSEVVCIDEFSKYGKVIVTTDDGSYGSFGNALDYLKNNPVNYDYYYACGPMKMLEALSKYDGNGSISLEARMGCGFGACMGCSIKTTKGYKRVCKEGPVFTSNEVIFDE